MRVPRRDGLRAGLDRHPGPAAAEGERRRTPERQATGARGDDRLAQQPRLVLRFAIYTAVGLAVAAAGILLFVRQHGIAQAERAVTFHARFVAESTLQDHLGTRDFRKPVGADRSAELDGFFRSRVLVGGTLGVTLYAPDGRVTYSTWPGQAGVGRDDAPRLRNALGGTVSSRVVAVPQVGRAGNTKALAAYVPVRLSPGRPNGAMAIYQDYAPIASAARKAFLPVAGVLEFLLVALYISLFPILRRVTERLRVQLREIEHQALHDGLTGLPNRELFRSRLDEALRDARDNRGGVAVLLLDLDRFKEINDALGHQSGDLLLQALGERLQGLVRGGDTVARLGGDEFAILSPGASSEEDTLALAERIRGGLEDPFVVGGLTFEVEASIGIALFPHHGEDVEAVIRHADVAMYVGKETHRATVYSPEDDHYSPDRLALVGELRRAMAEEELVVHYQPRVDIASGRTLRVEALVRWQHPERGLLSPSEFLPLAEHTGLIRPLTRYVLETALRDCARWEGEGLEVGVSVNLSERDLMDLKLGDEVEEVLGRFGVDSSRLELEITENSILKDPDRARAVLARLRERGVTLAIDDFGTGFSSLGRLQRLPVDVLKIDRSFVLSMSNDDDSVIVHSTIELGHNLGLEVVAEGVEDEATLTHLHELGCDTAQGYHLSRPLPAEELESWLRSRMEDDADPVRAAVA